MKSFLLSFIMASMACAALWYHWHGAAARLHTVGASPPNPGAPSTTPPVRTPEASAKALAAAERAWSGYVTRESREVPITANLTSVLDVVAATLTERSKENNEWSEDAHPGYLGAQMRDPSRKAEFIRWLQARTDPVIASRVFSIVFSQMKHEGAWLRPELMPDYMPGADQMPRTLEHPDTVWTMGALAEGLNPLTSLRDKERAPHPERTDAPKNYSLSTRLFYWARRDPESAGLWLKAQPPSPQVDEAARGYLQAVADENPAAAVLWAGQIADPGERVRQSADHYASWHRQQPAEAEAWLAAAEFPEVHRLYIAGLAAAKK